VMLTCPAGKEAKPVLHELTVNASGVTALKKTYTSDTFRAAVPAICQGK